MDPPKRWRTATPPPRPPHAALTRPGPQVALDGAVQDARHRPTQVVAPGQQVPQPVRERQHPLPHGDIRQHVVHQVRGAFGHPAAAATRTEAAPLARERDEPLGPAGVAPEPGEPAREEAAAQERAELGVDEPRQPLAAAQACRLDAKGLDVLAHDGVEHRRGRIARGVRNGRHTTGPVRAECQG